MGANLGEDRWELGELWCIWLEILWEEPILVDLDLIWGSTLVPDGDPANGENEEEADLVDSCCGDRMDRHCKALSNDGEFGVLVIA